MKTWKKLLPETIEVKKMSSNQGFIYKPVYGRVGERISIKEACRGDEYNKIIKDVKKVALANQEYGLSNKLSVEEIEAILNKYYK